MMATNDIWVTFRQGIPTDVFLSKETANSNKFHSETVQHYIHVENGGVPKTREEQLVQTNAQLQQQVDDLTQLLAQSENRRAA